MAPYLSLVVLGLLGAGILMRRRPRWHWPLMLSAFGLDLGLVIYLEGSRHAVETAATSIHPLVWVHATISLVVLGLWVAMLRLGWLMLHGRPAVRHTHRLLAGAFLVLRVANFATSLVLPHDSRLTETAIHR
jgi:hypothetical protein